LKDLTKLDGKHHVLVVNKSDLGEAECWSVPAKESVSVSCETGDGLEVLSDRITDMLSMSDIVSGGHVVAINARHQSCLVRAKESLGNGRVDTEEIFDEIFGTFCIGK